MASANQIKSRKSSGSVAMPTTPITNASLTHEGSGPWYKTTLTLPTSGTTLTVADQVANSVGAGGLKLLDFAEGRICVTASTNLDYSITAFTGDADMVSALGTVTAAADNGALTSTEANIIASTATALDGTGVFEAASTAIVWLDGTATAVDVYLNGGSGTTDWASDRAIAVTGTVVFLWCQIGDD